MNIILASASPRRKQLLTEVVSQFQIIPAHTEEVPAKGETPLNYVNRVSYEKAKCVADQFPDDLVLGADTEVILGNKIFGKPKDKEDARQMLKLLSGKKHNVITAVSIICKNKSIKITKQEKTEVFFNRLTDEYLNVYLNNSDYFDKAGAYAIQNSPELVQYICGDYTNVVGLPKDLVASMLMQIKRSRNVRIPFSKTV